MERFREQKKDLYLVFIDLEKAYDKIPRNVMWWSLDKHKVPSKYVTLIKDMYNNVVTTPKKNVEIHKLYSSVLRYKPYGLGVSLSHYE